MSQRLRDARRVRSAFGDLPDHRARTRRSRPRSCAGTARSPGRPCSRRGRTGASSRRPRRRGRSCPRSGCSKPAIIRRQVVLPEPEGPSIEKNSPSRTSRSTPSTATTSPKRLTTPSSRTAMSGVGGRRVIGAAARTKRSPRRGRDSRLTGARRACNTTAARAARARRKRQGRTARAGARGAPASGRPRRRVPRRSAPV